MRAVILALMIAVFALIMSGGAEATLSPGSAFALTQHVAPGEDLRVSMAYLGDHTMEAPLSGDLTVMTWGSPLDEWMLDVLNDGRYVRATRITWNVKGRRAQQTLFAQITSEGRKFFGTAPRFVDGSTAEWRELEGSLIMRAHIADELDGGVSLLTGVRNDAMASDIYGF